MVSISPTAGREAAAVVASACKVASNSVRRARRLRRGRRPKGAPTAYSQKSGKAMVEST